MFKNFLNKTNRKGKHTSTLICINLKRNNLKISSRKPKNSQNCENMKKKIFKYLCYFYGTFSIFKSIIIELYVS